MIAYHVFRFFNEKQCKIGKFNIRIHSGMKKYQEHMEIQEDSSGQMIVFQIPCSGLMDQLYIFKVYTYLIITVLLEQPGLSGIYNL